MNFSEFLSNLDKGRLEPGTEDALLKGDKDKILKKIKDICKELDDIGNTLTTEFGTETLRKTGYACYDFSDKLDEVKNLLLKTRFFDLSEKGLQEYLTDKLKGIQNFKKIVSAKNSYSEGEIKFSFVVEFDKPVDDGKAERDIKKALSSFEFVDRDTMFLSKDGENKLKFNVLSSNEVRIK